MSPSVLNQGGVEAFLTSPTNATVEGPRGTAFCCLPGTGPQGPQQDEGTGGCSYSHLRAAQ